MADDDSDDRELFYRTLQELDERAVCYFTGHGGEVFELLNARSDRFPHIIFLDVNMPRMDGRACLRQLKGDARYSGIPVIMYSTSALVLDTAVALEMGAVCDVVKLAGYDNLKEMLRTALANIWSITLSPHH